MLAPSSARPVRPSVHGSLAETVPPLTPLPPLLLQLPPGNSPPVAPPPGNVPGVPFFPGVPPTPTPLPGNVQLLPCASTTVGASASAEHRPKATRYTRILRILPQHDEPARGVFQKRCRLAIDVARVAILDVARTSDAELRNRLHRDVSP